MESIIASERDRWERENRLQALQERLADAQEQRRVSLMLADDAKRSWQILNEGWTDATGVKHKPLMQTTGDEMIDRDASIAQTYAEEMTKWRTEEAKRRGLTDRSQEEYAMKIGDSFRAQCAKLLELELGRQAAASVASVMRDETAQWNVKRGEWMLTLRGAREQAQSLDAAADLGVAAEDYGGVVDGVREQFARGVATFGTGIYRASAGMKTIEKSESEGILFAKGQLDATVKEFADAGEFGAAKALCEIYNDIDIRDRVGTEEAREKLKWVEGEEAKWIARKVRERREGVLKNCAENERAFLAGKIEGVDLEHEAEYLKALSEDAEIRAVAPEVSARYAEWAKLRQLGFGRGVTNAKEASSLVASRIGHVTYLKHLPDRAFAASEKSRDAIIQEAQIEAVMALDWLYSSGLCTLDQYNGNRKALDEVVSDNKRRAIDRLLTKLGLYRDQASLTESGVRVISGGGRSYTIPDKRLDGDVWGKLSEEQVKWCVDKVSAELDSIEQSSGGKAYAPAVVDEIIRSAEVELARRGFEEEVMSRVIAEAALMQTPLVAPASEKESKDVKEEN